MNPLTITVYYETVLLVGQGAGYQQKPGFSTGFIHTCVFTSL